MSTPNATIDQNSSKVDSESSLDLAGVVVGKILSDRADGSFYVTASGCEAKDIVGHVLNPVEVADGPPMYESMVKDGFWSKASVLVTDVCDRRGLPGGNIIVVSKSKKALENFVAEYLTPVNYTP